MFLKNIELSGFKSFADKVTLEFSERISAIIGPNGSGKSNIVDAIKWVLGEQSVKSLRGKSMEEVIFNGTTTRKPLSRASVSMTLVNEKGLLPVAFKEVTVSRQLYRSGESKYLINNAECRLKDVIELFMDTGLSKGAYSIISQGQISSILTANPYDRRLIFEEAAGIVKYKTRKKIALSKLEAAKQDLLRVSDILIELERQLRSLKYQAAKAERYKKVAEQLELTELLVSFFEYSALVEEITNINNERQIYLDKKTEIETKIAKENSEYEKQKITLFEIDTKVSEISKKIYELSEAIKQKEYKLMSNSNKIDNNLFKINQYSDETRELKFKIEELDKKINEENSQLLNASVKLLENIIDSEREKKNILDIENVLSENNKILDEYNKELLDKTHNSSEYKSRLSAITTELRTVKIQQQEIKEEKINKELQIANINEEQKILEENLSNVEKSHIEITETLNKFQEELNANIGHLEKLRNKQFEYKNLLLNARADLKVILDSEDEKYQDGIKELFDYFKKNNLSLAHKGLIGEHIKTEEIYEVAIGNALNELIQTIVIEDNNTLKETIDLITKKSLGKTRFLCAAESAEEKNQALEISKERGFLASAADVISCKNKEMNDIVKKIFSKIAIAQDYDSGIALKKKYSDFIFVTIDGIIFWNDGTITAGFVKENRNILKRDRQKEELVQKIEFFGKTLKEIENHIIELETHQIELKKNINNIQRTQKELELEKNGITNKLDNNKKSLITLENELTKISEKIMILNSRENELIELEKKINIELLEINNKSEKISLKIKSLSEKIENIKLEKNEKMKNVNSYDVRCAELKQQQESFKRSMFDKQLLIEDYEKKIENNKKLTVELQNEIEIIKKENEAINIEINNLIKERDKWLNDKNIEQQARENLFAILNNIEEQSKAQRIELNAYQNKIHEYDILLSQKYTRQDSVLENIYTRYSIEPDKFKEQKWLEKYSEKEIENLKIKSINELKEELRNLELKLKSIGPVNINAIEEYKEVEQRYLFLQAQKKDLEEAERDLVNVIEKINDKAEKKFLETFRKVNKYFGELIAELFNGGSGEISLIDENDALESGIEITVRPPGKKILNIMSLSGGEQAMSAIGLIFALFKVKPSPFCLLDEIDAPLDDANLSRFLKMLKKFAEHSQFIIITHHKKTMAACDVLYGVSMEEKGVSKVLSVRISENNKNYSNELAG